MLPRRKQRKTNPVIFVFCEGDTEQKYIDMLRTHFRIHIQIVTKVLNTRISQKTIDTYIKNSGYPNIDQIFLFYDGDRQDITDRLYEIANVQVMLSCPCVELWFLLHFTEHNQQLSSDKMVKKLLNHHPAYRKGEIQPQLKEILLSNWEMAAARAKRLKPKENPSTTAYILSEYLESIKKK